MLSRLTRLGMAGAFVLAGATLMTPQAEASASAYVCTVNQLCFYQNADFTGSVYVALTTNVIQSGQTYVFIEDANGYHYTNGDSLDNSISSYASSLPLEVDLYTGTYFTGVEEWSDPYLSIRQVKYDNQATSIEAIGRV